MERIEPMEEKEPVEWRERKESFKQRQAELVEIAGTPRKSPLELAEMSGQQTPRRWGWGTPLKKRTATRTK